MQNECGLHQIHFSAGGSAALRYATAAAGSRYPWRSVDRYYPAGVGHVQPTRLRPRASSKRRLGVYSARADKYYQSILTWAAYSTSGDDFLERINKVDFLARYGKCEEVKQSWFSKYSIQRSTLFCRRFLVKVPGAPEPSAAAFSAEMTSLRKTLFENLLLFDKLSVKVTGESIPISLLIGALGRMGLDALIEQRAIEFVLWNENVGFLVKNIPGVDGMCRASRQLGQNAWG